MTGILGQTVESTVCPRGLDQISIVYSVFENEQKIEVIVCPGGLVQFS